MINKGVSLGSRLVVIFFLNADSWPLSFTQTFIKPLRIGLKQVNIHTFYALVSNRRLTNVSKYYDLLLEGLAFGNISDLSIPDVSQT